MGAEQEAGTSIKVVVRSAIQILEYKCRTNDRFYFVDVALSRVLRNGPFC
jgi:hypothetical protein